MRGSSRVLRGRPKVLGGSSEVLDGSSEVLGGCSEVLRDCSGVLLGSAGVLRVCSGVLSRRPGVLCGCSGIGFSSSIVWSDFFVARSSPHHTRTRRRLVVSSHILFRWTRPVGHAGGAENRVGLNRL